QCIQRDLHQGFGRIQPTSLQSLQHAVTPVHALPQVQRTVQKGQVCVPGIEQMLHGQGCAAHIVHRHRSQVGGGGGVVQQYRFDVPLPQLQQRIQTALGGGRDHPAHTV